MTYIELYERACRKLDNGEITLGEYERMIQPLKQEVCEWTLCSDGLPEYGAEVLTYNDHDDDYEINHIIDDEDIEWFYDGVFAWMPLPRVVIGGVDNGNPD